MKMATLPSLKALAESKSDGIQKATYFKISPSLIEFEEGFNLREEGAELDAHIERLYLAMREGAYIPPIDVSVVDGRVIARDGHCRTRAACRIVADGIDYKLEARQLRGNDADAVFHMLGSGQGKSFTPLEQGRGYLRLVRFGFDIAAIAKKTGVHRTTVENGLALAESPVAVQAMVTTGKVASSLALMAVKKHGSNAESKLSDAINTALQSGKTKATAKHIEPEKKAGDILALVQAHRTDPTRQSYAAMANAVRKMEAERDGLRDAAKQALDALLLLAIECSFNVAPDDYSQEIRAIESLRKELRV